MLNELGGGGRQVVCGVGPISMKETLWVGNNGKLEMMMMNGAYYVCGGGG